MPGQKFGPAWFPGLIAIGLGLCGAGLIASGLRSREPWLVVPGWVARRRPVVGVAAIIAGLLFYIAAVDAVGFHLTGIALIAFWVRILGASWRVTVPVAILVPILIHLTFYKLLRVPLPWGIFETWAF
jgi:putative tricarboxylic transport membrane protein